MFARIVAKNMFSWKELDYTIQPGLSQIIGYNCDDKNQEGVGKSSIFNILSWTLFGKVPKDINIDDVIREGEASCSGTVYLFSGSRITRKRKPNELRLELFDKETETYKTVVGKDAKDVQLSIEKEIGMSFDTFCQVIYFPQNYPKKFISANETDKAKILADIQDLSVFDRARKDVVRRIASAESEYTFSKHLLNKNQSILDELDKQATFVKKRIESFQDAKAIRLEIIKSRTSKFALELYNISEELEKQLPELIHTPTNPKELELDYNLIVKDYDRTNWEIQRLKTIKIRLENQEKKDIRECPECGAIVSIEHIREEMNKTSEHLEKLEIQFKDLMNLKDFLMAEINSVKTEENKKIREVQARGKARVAKTFEKDKIQAILEREWDLLTEVEKSSCSEDLKEYNKILSKCEKMAKDISNLEAAFAKHKEEMEHLLHLKDGFREVKSIVFSSLLQDLSNKSTGFASELFETPIEIKFTNEEDDGSISKIKTIIVVDGYERSLGLLSGGQARRVQIAVDLALSEIVSKRSKNPINFRMFDEIMKDLSESSQEKVVRLLSGLNGYTIIIEHSPLIKAVIDNVFEIEYSNGISRVAQ